jgi:hypothetical protein
LFTKWLDGGDASLWPRRARDHGKHSQLNCLEKGSHCIATKEKKRSHYLGNLPFILSTAKEKQAKAIIVVWVSVQREREKKEASSR